MTESVSSIVYDIVSNFVSSFLGLLVSMGISIDEYVGNFEFMLLSPVLFVFILPLIFLPLKLFMYLVEVIFNV